MRGVRARVEPNEPSGMNTTSREERAAGKANASDDANPTSLPADVRALLVAALAEALVLDYQDDADARGNSVAGKDHDTRPDTA